jgi:ribosomal protein S27AE
MGQPHLLKSRSESVKQLAAETRQAIVLYCETGTFLATHPHLPDRHYDFLVEQASKPRETFSFDDLLQSNQVDDPPGDDDYFCGSCGYVLISDLCSHVK